MSFTPAFVRRLLIIVFKDDNIVPHVWNGFWGCRDTRRVVLSCWRFSRWCNMAMTAISGFVGRRMAFSNCFGRLCIGRKVFFLQNSIQKFLCCKSVLGPWKNGLITNKERLFEWHFCLQVWKLTCSMKKENITSLNFVSIWWTFKMVHRPVPKNRTAKPHWTRNCFVIGFVYITSHCQVQEVRVWCNVLTQNLWFFWWWTTWICQQKLLKHVFGRQHALPAKNLPDLVFCSAETVVSSMLPAWKKLGHILSCNLAAPW